MGKNLNCKAGVRACVCVLARSCKVKRREEWRMASLDKLEALGRLKRKLWLVEEAWRSRIIKLWDLHVEILLSLFYQGI